MTQLAVISEATVPGIITRKLAYNGVQQVFEGTATGLSKMFDVVICKGLNDGDFFGERFGQRRIPIR